MTGVQTCALPISQSFPYIGDYWDDEAVAKIADLLHEYQNLFPTNFSEMRGIVGELGYMKIPLRLDAKPTKQRKKTWHDQHIKVKPSKEGGLVLLYDNKFFKHLGKPRTH